MTTRLYLPASGTAPISPAFDAAWEATGAPTRRPLSTAKSEVSAAASVAVVTTSNTPAGAVDVAVAQFISAPLSGSQTISGAIKGIIRAQESNAAADMRAQCVIRVVDNAGTTVRGTLIAASAAALSNEWNTALRNIRLPLAWAGSGATPTSVNALNGDRIVIEVGFRKHESAVTSRTGTLSFGDSSGADLAENETGTTADDPWFEFADTLVFQAVPERVSQTPTLVAATPVPAGRISQTVALVAAIAPRPINVSQVVGLVATHPPITMRVSQTVALVAVPFINTNRVSQTVALVAVTPSVVGAGYSWVQVID